MLIFNYQDTREVVLRRNKFQFLPIPVFLFWLTIAVQRSITPLKENNQCTISLETRVLINNSRAICYQVVSVCFSHFWGKGSPREVPIICTREASRVGEKSRPMEWIWRQRYQKTEAIFSRILLLFCWLASLKRKISCSPLWIHYLIWIINTFCTCLDC